ncbi:protein split ends [Trichonephila clavata]|uniref:Protein split ends n=1 Tax=Trichonephila clavata TaxID=2740835 RepID=A0A8X6KLX2_TRICU|nr:protein split ends [Trichonephila clavata]
MLNSCPLTYIFVDLTEPEPLTPSHMILGRRVNSLSPTRLNFDSSLSSRKILIKKVYPFVWLGTLQLKNCRANVQLHYVSGNPRIARESLPFFPTVGPNIQKPIVPYIMRIVQRMRLEPEKLKSVEEKMQISDEHCVLLALPFGRNLTDFLLQLRKFKSGIINYFERKNGAGIVNAALPGSEKPFYLISMFPSCEFSDSLLTKFPENIQEIIRKLPYLMVVIQTV